MRAVLGRLGKDALCKSPARPARDRAEDDHIKQGEQYSKQREPGATGPPQNEKPWVHAQPAIDDDRADKQHDQRNQDSIEHRRSSRPLIPDDPFANLDDEFNHVPNEEATKQRRR
jgi:hypothetical protein